MKRINIYDTYGARWNEDLMKKAGEVRMMTDCLVNRGNLLPSVLVTFSMLLSYSLPLIDQHSHTDKPLCGQGLGCTRRWGGYRNVEM